MPAVSYDYATRVTNLVQTFKHRATEAAAVARAEAKPAPAPKVPVLSLEAPVVTFVVNNGAPLFELTATPEPEIPMVELTPRLEDLPVVTPSAHSFSFTTTATLTPSFTL